MAEQKWEKQLMDFIKRTGDEIKRTGEEIKVEAQRLLDEVRDPARQAKVKESPQGAARQGLGHDQGCRREDRDVVRNIEDAVGNALDKNEDNAKAKPATAPSAAAAEEPAPAPKSARKAGKTIGKKAGAKKAAGEEARRQEGPQVDRPQEALGLKIRLPRAQIFTVSPWQDARLEFFQAVRGVGTVVDP